MNEDPDSLELVIVLLLSVFFCNCTRPWHYCFALIHHTSSLYGLPLKATFKERKAKSPQNKINLRRQTISLLLFCLVMLSLEHVWNL